MKYNFSVYASVWDRILGTYWAADSANAQEKYARGREVAEDWLAKDKAKVKDVETASAVSTAID